MPKRIKIILSVLLFSILFPLTLFFAFSDNSVASAASSVSYAGADTTTNDAWRTTDVTKPLDGDGDNVYGTDGYYVYANGLLGSSLPSYASVSTLGGILQFSGGGSYTDFDTPSLSGSGPIADQFTGVWYQSTSASIASEWFDITFSADGNYRIGIVTDNADAAAISPLDFRMQQTVGGSADSGSQSAASDRDQDLDYYFFDVEASSGDVFRLSGTNDTGFGSNGIGGIFFDSLPSDLNCADSAWTVTSEAEMNEAIACYNNKSAAGTYTITLSNNITLTASLTDTNSLTETAMLQINGGGFAIDGQNISGIRPFWIEADTHVTMQNLIIQDGTMGHSSGGGNGGAIYNNGGHVTLNQVLLKDNTGRQGGAISNSGFMTITNSVIQGNSATPSGDGAGIAGAIVQTGSGATLYVENSTFTGNITSFSDRAIIKIEASTTAEFINTSIVDNFDRGLNASGTLTMTNSILSGNSTASCYSGTPISGGYNIVDDTSCSFSATGDMTNTNPLLDSFIDNGDYTSRFEPDTSSPAVNAIPPGTNGCAIEIANDQIGAARSLGPGCEIGSIELEIIYDLTTVKSGNGSGAISSSPAGIDCGITCTLSYSEGSEIFLSALADTGSTFDGWSGGDCSGTDDCPYLFDADKTVTATFTLELYDLTINAIGLGGGTISSSPIDVNCTDTCVSDIDYGTTLTFTATPNSESEFVGWSGACTGTDTCVITVTDTTTLSGEFDLTPNNPPTATNDVFTLEQNTVLTGNVIINDNGIGADIDLDGDSLTATVSSDVTNGLLSLDPSGSFIYTPTQNYTGTDQFVYELTDGETYDPPITATVTISIVEESVPIIFPPVAVDDTAQTDQGQPVSVDVLANDTDQDTETLILAAVGTPTSGSAVISGTLAVYSPTVDFVGSATFTYTVSDGESIDEGLVTVTVTGAVQLEDIDSGFRPSSNGYKFANYGTTQGSADTPSASVMIEMFGAPAVCKQGTLNEAGNDCILDSHVFALVNTTLGKTYGQAYGMTVSSMRFFMGLDQPSQIVSGTQIVPLINQEKAIQDHIGRYTLQQSTQPADGESGWKRNRTVAEVLTAIKTELNKEELGDPLLLLLYATDSGNSHSLFPYRVKETAANQYDVYVYDVNFPLDNARIVQVDLNSMGWAYSTSIPESEAEVNLSGSDGTSIIDLRLLSAHQPTNLKVIGSSGSPSTREGKTLFLTGQPLAFTTENCFKIEGGASFDNSPDAQGNCKGSNELPDSGGLQCLRGADGLSADSGDRGSNQICGLDGSVSENMQFTLYEDENTFRRTGSSTGHNMTFMTDVGNVLNVETPDSLSGAGDLSLDISPDAERVTVDPGSTAGQTPELSFAVRGTTENQPSYMVKIKPTNLGEGSTFSAEIDPATGHFFFEDDDGEDVSYSIEIEQVNSDGTESKFENNNVKLDGESAYVDFGTWDGEEIDLFVDEEGDGFGDEQSKPIKNRANVIYLPLVTNK